MTGVNIRHTPYFDPENAFTLDQLAFLVALANEANNDVDAVPLVSTGTAAPATTPSVVGDIFVDATNNRVYIATGTSSSTDWTEVTGGGGGGGTWGSITGTLSDQTDLQTALNGKANTSHTHTLANITDVTMTVANLNSLDDGADSTLHFHASDRSRANHTGTQAASTISDFNEAAQDAIGLIVDTSLVYNDATPLLSRAALTGAITASAGSNTTALGSFTLAQLNTAISDADVATGGGTATGSNTSDVTLAGTPNYITIAGQVITRSLVDLASHVTGDLPFANIAQIATDRLLGRDTAGTGDIESLTVGGGIEFTGAGGIQTSAFTGDVTKTAGGTALTVANDAVTNAKLANMAANTIKGNNTGVSADPIDLTTAQTTAMLDLFTTSLKGLAPASGGGTTNFLRADGTWAAPPSGFADPLTTNGDIIARIGGVTTRLAQGANGTFLGVSGGALGYYTPAGGGGTNFNTIYIDQAGGTSDTYGVLGGARNGSNTVFTVSQAAYASGTLKVWRNGQLMTQGTGDDFTETTPASGTFTFAVAPASTDEITVEYQLVAASGTSFVTKTGDTMTGDLVVPDEAYNQTAWNGNNEVPTKNAVRDMRENLFGVTVAIYQGFSGI